jgi:hypothetical protein
MSAERCNACGTALRSHEEIGVGICEVCPAPPTLAQVALTLAGILGQVEATRTEEARTGGEAASGSSLVADASPREGARPSPPSVRAACAYCGDSVLGGGPWHHGCERRHRLALPPAPCPGCGVLVPGGDPWHWRCGEVRQ